MGYMNVGKQLATMKTLGQRLDLLNDVTEKYEEACKIRSSLNTVLYVHEEGNVVGSVERQAIIEWGELSLKVNKIYHNYATGETE